MRLFGNERAKNIGIIINTTYTLGWILHIIAVTCYIFSDVETKEKNIRKKTIAKWTVYFLFIINGLSNAIVQNWTWVGMWIIMLLGCVIMFKGTMKNRQHCADKFSLMERRSHLVLCFKILCGNLPTQLYFIGELSGCLIRQLNYKSVAPEGTFELMENSCNGVLYSIAPIAVFNGWCIVQYINYGFHKDLQHNVVNIARLHLSFFQIYRVANSALLVCLAVFAYSLRHEDPPMDIDGKHEHDHSRSTTIVIIALSAFLVFVEVVGTFLKVIYGLMSSTLLRFRAGTISNPNKELLPSDGEKLSIDARFEDRDNSLWSGGSKGARNSIMPKALGKEKSVAVFEISPGFL